VSQRRGLYLCMPVTEDGLESIQLCDGIPYHPVTCFASGHPERTCLRLSDATRSTALVSISGHPLTWGDNHHPRDRSRGPIPTPEAKASRHVGALSIGQLPSDFVYSLKAEGSSFGEVIFGLFLAS
jgi:hypothetical protein